MENSTHSIIQLTFQQNFNFNKIMNVLLYIHSTKLQDIKHFDNLPQKIKIKIKYKFGVVT